MEKAAAPAEKVRPKRSKGRPVSGENDVGRERLLDATEKLLRILPPARVTVARISKEAGVDPALVRYYFGDRTQLLMAVANRVTAGGPHSGKRTLAPVLALEDYIRQTLEFTRSTPFMHRLMLEELGQQGTETTRARSRDMNLDIVSVYSELLEADAGRTLRPVDPLMLHLVVLGASDFFASAEPLIREIAPPGVDMDELGARFKTFLAEVLLEGLKIR